MSTSPEKFTGTPLVAGEVFGIRAWDVDTLGRISSPSYKHIWTPGENLAECQRDRSPQARYYASAGLSSFGISIQMPSYSSHDLLRLAGIWPQGAYKFVDQHYRGFELTDVVYDSRSNAYTLTIKREVSGRKWRAPETSRVTVAAEMIDEASGKKKAKPEPKPEPPHDFTTCSCGFYAYTNGTNDYSDHEVIGVVQGYGETHIGTRGFRSSKAKIVAAYASTYADIERVRPLPVSMDRMQQLYPDVAWFTDYAAMVAEFPPSDPEPTPDTDDNFWTRSA